MARILFVFALLLSAIQAFGKGTPDFSETASLLEKAIADHAFPGCSVVVGTDKKILWSKGFGRFDYNSGSRVTRDTIYDLASVTKVTGTTSVFMRLVALGKINVDEPVGKYIPEFIAAGATPDEQQWRRAITIEHLLTHTSGLTSWKPFYRSVTGYSNLMHAIYQTPMECAPGTRFRYSDPGMMMLGEVAARAGGKPLAILEQELVFKPFKMKNTMRNPSTRLLKRIPPTEKWPDRDDFVHGVVHDENSRAGEGITGHAGLFATAEDLARLSQELLRADKGASKLIPKKVSEQFFAPARTLKDLDRGLGWGLDLRTSGDGTKSRVLNHTGFTGTSIRIDLDENVFVVLLTNRVHPSRDNEKIGRVRRELSESVYHAIESSRR